MSISKHIHSLQQHLARLGLHPVPGSGTGQSEVFKICFLNKYEMQQWQKLHAQTPDAATDGHHNAFPVDDPKRR